MPVQLKEVQSAFWDKQFIVSETPTGDNTMMQISIVTKKGESYVAYREFYNTKTDPTWKASKHGGATKAKYFNDVLQGMTLALEVILEGK